MRKHPIICLIFQFIIGVPANTEKTVFKFPQAVPPPTQLPTPLCLPVLTPRLSAIYRRLTVSPPAHVESLQDRIREDWYLLHELQIGHRYEVRVCSVATQPTKFWLDIFSFSEVAGSSELISSLTKYSERSQKEICSNIFSAIENEPVLFLRLRSTSDFVAAERTLMQHPLDVGADIILDSYLLDILPQSLIPTVALTFVIAIYAWFLSGMTWRTLQDIVIARRSKSHLE
ncbi:hypothetical protein, variant [Verruconis gallopava]|uniref:Uncharacterized protein n=1 Tax=Verruconis gallopava TaxID=253628 RepID=A0A0D1ZW05_9PEZI|nr:uncharacterized protein PV09_09570 [Verruconis gallopava]XP_016208527.1 hypothetical protein, variant [Verruconis gallopava]KIV98656.1 hypothetical protein PV09_09570 [Verruconis gallopava]KIV98657.1 hypothetical protein, variant [Verruconis gallopava]